MDIVWVVTTIWGNEMDILLCYIIVGLCTAIWVRRNEKLPMAISEWAILVSIWPWAIWEALKDKKL